MGIITQLFNNPVYILARLLAVVIAFSVHEFAHGFVADKLGDPTPRTQGRLTLNPRVHIDLIGMIMLFLFGFGFAKPVEIDTRYYKNPKRGMALTAFAGPLSNFILAFIFMIPYKILFYFVPMSGTVNTVVMTVFNTLILTNIGLGMFNMLPIPPLDGSKVFRIFLPDKACRWLDMAEYRYRMFIMIALFALISTGILNIPLYFLQNLLLSAISFLTGFIDLIAKAVLPKPVLGSLLTTVTGFL